MNSKEQKVFDVVKANPWKHTAEIARLADIMSSDSNGGHQNWEVHYILEDFERQGIFKSKKGGMARNSLRLWHVT